MHHQLLQSETPAGRRFYLNGKRISEAEANDLKRDHDQDTFQTKINDQVTRQYSYLRTR